MKIITAVIFFCALSFSQSIVRVYCRHMSDLTRISAKIDLDIAAARAGEWYDIVADRTVMDRIIASGLPYEVRIFDLEYQKEQARGYHSYADITMILRNMASTYPAICKLDSLPIKTFQNRWIYALKISDNPFIEEENEPGLLVDGCHHAREWATIEVVLYFANHFLSQYATNSEIRDIVDNTEIYCVPVVNVDGYIYDYNGNGQVEWRWNREPFEGTIGTDCNRNYGCCSGDLKGDWGAADSSKAMHRPGAETFCGPCANSGNEIQALTIYAGSRIINAYMSYHSYGELLMWGWGYTQAPIPDVETASRFGNRMASMVNRIDGGTYTPGQVSSVLYYTSGASEDWLYSWMHWVAGVANLSYVTEVGYSFYPTQVLDSICRCNFNALKYLAQLTRDSIPMLCEGVVAPPQVYDIGSVGANFTVRWHPLNSFENHPIGWELVEFSDPSVITDSLESGFDRWILKGFALATNPVHSGTHSFFSGNVAGQNTVVTSIHPYLVKTGDSLTFWCYYNLEPGHDVAVAEVSENNLEWFNIDTLRFTGEQINWQRKAYSLTAWIGRSVFIRFRCMYDDGTQYGGLYLDDIWPACRFDTVQSISQNITDTLYQFTNHATGTYYYCARGNNAAWGWGEYSTLKQADVILGVAEHQTPDATPAAPYITLSPNPTRIRMEIRFLITDNRLRRNSDGIKIDIYDATGSLIKVFHQPASAIGHPSSISWNLCDQSGHKVPSGVYLIHLSAGDFIKTTEALILK